MMDVGGRRDAGDGAARQWKRQADQANQNGDRALHVRIEARPASKSRFLSCTSPAENRDDCTRHYRIGA